MKEPVRKAARRCSAVLTAISAAPTFRLAHQIVGQRLAGLTEKASVPAGAFSFSGSVTPGRPNPSFRKHRKQAAQSPDSASASIPRGKRCDRAKPLALNFGEQSPLAPHLLLRFYKNAKQVIG